MMSTKHSIHCRGYRGTGAEYVDDDCDCGAVMPEPDCQYCGAKFSHAVGNDTVWACGTRRCGSGKASRPTGCRITQLAAENKRLRMFVYKVREERGRIEQLVEERSPGLVEHRLAESLLDALAALDANPGSPVAVELFRQVSPVQVPVEPVEMGDRPVAEVLEDVKRGP